MKMPTCQMHLLALSFGLNVRNVGERGDDSAAASALSNRVGHA